MPFPKCQNVALILFTLFLCLLLDDIISDMLQSAIQWTWNELKPNGYSLEKLPQFIQCGKRHQHLISPGRIAHCWHRSSPCEDADIL